MAKEFVCVPVSEDQLRRLRAGEELRELQVFRVDDHLLAAFGLTVADDEEADRAAMLLASLWALSRHGRRLVLTAFVSPQLVGDAAESANGGAAVQRLRPRDVEAVFADERSADDAIRRARESVRRDSSLDEIWDQPCIQDLLNSHELLWHTLDEADALLAQSSLPAR